MKETKPSQKIQITKEILEELYINQGLSVRECSKKLGLPSHGGIVWRLKKFGIKTRPARFQKGNTLYKIKKGKESPFYKGGKIEQKCKECGKSFKIFPSQMNAFTRCDECKKKRFDLTGRKFGLLEVIKKHGHAKGGHILWLCKCECGNTKTVRSPDLKSGRTKSCGCEQGLKGEKNPQYKEKIKISCATCGAEKEIFPCHNEEYDKHFCDIRCYGEWRSKNIRGEKNPKWIGGSDVCGYDTYAEQISFAEDVRRNPDDINIIQVKCAYCGRWFNPSSKQMSARVRVLYGKKGGKGEARFYCSDRCKLACPIYKKILHPEGFSKKAKSATSREVQPELRQMRLALDDYACQRCQRTIDEAELHCHHITGIEQNPIESADLDNCITLCKKCHKWSHTQEGCRYFELKCD
jgi:hypothetical protein